MSKTTKIITLITLFLVLPLIVSAATLGETRNFYIDSSYDISERKEISATLQRISNQLYFYIDNTWWQGLSSGDQNKISIELYNLANEFERKIYPTLTSVFGSEWKPGIDKDDRITVLIHPMKKNTGGYFNSGDEYSKILVPTSNQREMVYLNADFISIPLAKSLLAHEFLHLITFNQKDRIQGIEEEVWLNEARAEFAPTLLGYDSQYQGSNLQRRVREFLNTPSDSITEWQNTASDYGAVNLFTQYLVDHYGVKILADSLWSSKKGIGSINYVLSKNGYKEDFSQVFTDWTIAVLVNDCSLAPLDSKYLTGVGSRYCYKNENLKNLRLVPVSNFLPLTSESTLSVNYLTKSWTGNWHKIFGGGEILNFEFQGGLNGNFKVPYVLCDFSQKCQVNFLNLNQYQMAKMTIGDFNKKYASFTIIPSSQKEFLNGITPNFSFSWQAKTGIAQKEEPELIKNLLAQIEELKKQITEIQAKINVILAGRNQKLSCQKFERDLYFGMQNNSEIHCLQEFLRNQGPDVYPEGLVTGNFLSLTKSAVIRFQEKHASEILAPLGLEKGTGYLGSMTRNKINNLISQPR